MRKVLEGVCLSMTELMPAVVVVVMLLFFCRGSGLGIEFIVCLAGTDLRLRIMIQARPILPPEVVDLC